MMRTFFPWRLIRYSAIALLLAGRGHLCQAQSADSLIISGAAIERLPSLDSLIGMAQARSQKLRSFGRNVDILTEDAAMRRKDWMDGIGLYSNAAYGSSNISSLNEVPDEISQLLVRRSDVILNVGVSARISLGYLLKRPHQQQVYALRIDQAVAERNEYGDVLALKITDLYEDLQASIEQIPSKAENLEALRMSQTIAEKMFAQGNIDANSYAMILSQRNKAQEELDKTRALVRKQFREMQFLTGWQTF